MASKDINYFNFFEIYPPRFFLDEKQLRAAFLKNSRAYHPDFYTLESEEKQAEMLEQSTVNNQGYKVLSDFHSRLKYLLEIQSVIGDGEKASLPPSFLMEMMEINEGLMELEFDFDLKAFEGIQKEVNDRETVIWETAKPLLESYPSGEGDEEKLLAAKEYYFKRQYLLRIRENLNKFAPL